MCPRPVNSFNFHAEGHAFSAVFTRPVPTHIDAKAATSLPTIGGHAHHRVEDFEAPRIVRFRAAHTHVSGSIHESEGWIIATTHSTTTLEHVNVLDFITADRITARLTSEHILGKVEGYGAAKSDDYRKPSEEGHIIAVGSRFENLKIGGFEFIVKLRHNLLLDCDTHQKLDDWLTANTAKSGIVGRRGGVTLCSLVEEIKTDFPGLGPILHHKHIFKIPHFGTISLAEVLSESGTKTLTMLRFDLGSPDGGTGTMAQARTNGQGSPPVPGGG